MIKRQRKRKKKGQQARRVSKRVSKKSRHTSGNQSTKWLRIGIVGLFLIGFLILTFPLVTKAINTYYDFRTMERFDEELRQKNKVLQKKKQLLEEKNQEQQTLPLGAPIEELITGEQTDGHSGLTKEMFQAHSLGRVVIPKVAIDVPLFDETTETLLQEGVTLLQGTSQPTGGKGRHTVITGHTGLPNKTLFTPINQLTIGDTIYVRALDQDLAYQVEQVKIVLPDDLTDLECVEGQDLLTLVTCTPIQINSHRLLVRAHRIPVTEKQVETSVAHINRKHTRHLLFYGMITVIISLGSAVIIGRQLLNV
ncbi:class C sortase [Vagococcus penaei]|nr:class C sortase [Vagococcus penaei]